MTTLSTKKQRKAALLYPVPLTTMALVDGQWDSTHSLFLFRNLKGTSYMEDYTSPIRIKFLLNHLKMF